MPDLRLIFPLNPDYVAAHSVDIKRIENDIECVQFPCWKVIITIGL